jgi:hypothetical protein
MTVKTALKRNTSLLLAFAISLIPIATAIITLNYLGLTLNDDHEIDSKNWQRKWLIVFAWLYVISYVLGLLFIRV